jgi:hypothetical protein
VTRAEFLTAIVGGLWLASLAVLWHDDDAVRNAKEWLVTAFLTETGPSG